MIAFVAALTWSGWRRGLLQTLAGLAFIGISFLLGAYLSGPFGNLVNSFFPDVPADYAALLGYAFVFPRCADRPPRRGTAVPQGS